MIKSEEEALSLVKELSEEEEQVQTLKDEKENLAYILKCKEEELRKLKLVKAYRVKNDLTHIEELIEKWRSVAVIAIEELHMKNSTISPKLNMAQFLNMLQIDPEFIRYDAEAECFK